MGLLSGETNLLSGFLTSTYEKKTQNFNQNLSSVQTSDSRQFINDITYAPQIAINSAGASQTSTLKKELTATPVVSQTARQTPSISTSDSQGVGSNNNILIIGAIGIGAVLLMGGKK